MHTETCKRCAAAFTKETEQLAKNAVAAHFTMKHGNGRSSLRSNGRANGHKHDHVHNEPLERLPTEDRPKARGPYKKKVKPIEPVGFKYNWCPNCGFDIQRAAIGYIMAADIKR